VNDPNTDMNDLNTYILLCQFRQDDLATVQAVGRDLKNKTQALMGRQVVVNELSLTMTEFEAVLVVQAPDEAAAREVLEIFAPYAPRDDGVTLLTVTRSDGQLNAFEGHTKMA
jgi:uncharacterized protein with GYD domain